MERQLIRRTFQACVYHVSINRGQRLGKRKKTNVRRSRKGKEMQRDMRYWWFIYEPFSRSASRRVLCFALWDSVVRRSWCNYVNLLTTSLAQVAQPAGQRRSRTIAIRGRLSSESRSRANKLSPREAWRCAINFQSVATDLRPLLSETRFLYLQHFAHRNAIKLNNNYET